MVMYVHKKSSKPGLGLLSASREEQLNYAVLMREYFVDQIPTSDESKFNQQPTTS